MANITESTDEEEFEKVKRNFCPVCLFTIAVLFGEKLFVSGMGQMEGKRIEKEKYVHEKTKRQTDRGTSSMFIVPMYEQGD